jgi:hypothetical protein
MQRPDLVRPGKPVIHALGSVTEVASLVFGGGVGQSLRALWASREMVGGDLTFLNVIEQKAFDGASSGPLARYGIRDRIRACEAIVRYLAECAAARKSTDPWMGAWGGNERLARMLRDALPQVRNELRSEFSCLMIATAVIGSAVLCLGAALQLDDPNNGVPVTDQAAAAERMHMYERVEDVITELSGFAVNCLEEAAVAEEAPAWRSLGVWLLLLSSRCGCMLRASRCNHARAAKVLRAWGGSSTAVHGSSQHQSHASSHVRAGSMASSGGCGAGGGGGGVPHGAQGRGYGGSTSGAPASIAGGGGGGHHSHASPPPAGGSTTEGVSAVAANTALAVLDASDTSGDDATLRALCSYLMH